MIKFIIFISGLIIGIGIGMVLYGLYTAPEMKE